MRRLLLSENKRVQYYCCILLLTILPCCYLHAQDIPLTITPVPAKVNGLQNPVLSLNGLWRFKVNRFGEEKNILVPGEWEMQGFTVAEADTAVYYRDIVIPADWKGKNIYIRFDAVSSHAVVKINGTTVKEHEGGFVPFEADITNVLKEGRNELVVEVQARTISDILAATSQYAGHTVGGILRKITLFALPPEHISDFTVHTVFDENYQHAQLKFSMAAKAGQSFNNAVAIRHILKDTLGKIVVDQIIHPAQNTQRGNLGFYSYSFAIPSPKHWNPEHPYLYTLVSELLINNRPVQTLSQKTGFRELKIRGNRLLLNGRAIKLHGVNRHETHPYEGRSLPPEWSRKDAELFRNGNCNFIRTAHYPPSEEFLQAADELGLLVESEAALCRINHPASPVWQKWDYRNSMFLPYLLQANAGNILNGRNHPCVISWSLANESTWSPLWENVLQQVRQWDNTRPVLFHDQCWGDYNNTGSKADIANYHYPDALTPSRADSNTTRPTLFGAYAHVSTYNRRELETDPGIRSMYGKALTEMYDSIYNHPGCLGGAIWSGIDDNFHLSDRQVTGYGPWGVVDAWRRKKPEYYGMKKAYSPVVIKSIDSISEKNKAIWVEVENRFDFTNLSDLNINCKLDGKQSEIQSVSVAPHGKGKLYIPVLPHTREIYLTFEDPRGFTCNEEHIILRRDEPVQDTLVKLQYTENNTAYLVKQGMFDFTISKQNGLVTAAKYKGKLILDRGPVFGIVPVSKDDGGKPAVAGESWQTEINPLPAYPMTVLFAESTFIQQSDSCIKITAELVFKEAKGRQTYTFTNDGKFITGYEIKYTGKAVLPRQYGLFMQLPQSYNKLNWERKTTDREYPSNDINRAKGEAMLNAKTVTPETVFRKIQGNEWKEDANEMGSNDFRSTKTNITSLKLEDVTGTGIRVSSEGNQSGRAWRQDQMIRLLVADYNSPGSEPFYKTPFIDKQTGEPVKTGHVFAGNLTVSLFQLSDSMLQLTGPAAFTIGAAKDGRFLFRGQVSAMRIYNKALEPETIARAAALPDDSLPAGIQPAVEFNFAHNSDTVYWSSGKKYKASLLNYFLQRDTLVNNMAGLDLSQGYLKVHTDTGLALGNRFSVECRVNVQTPNSGMYIMDFFNPATQEKFSLEIKDELLVAAHGKTQADEYWEFTPGKWMQVMVVCKDTLLPEIYINGKRGAKYRNSEQVTIRSPATSPGNPLQLWYTKPAATWTEAMVIGNGNMGGMVMGGITDEIIYLNNDELWSGYPRQLQNPRALKSMEVVRRLLREGKAGEAESYADKNLHMPYTEAYLPMGMLHLRFPVSGNVQAYRRDLDISTAIAGTEYVYEGTRYNRQVFASHPAKAIIIRLEADKKGAISFTAQLNSLLQHTVEASGNLLRLKGRAPVHTDHHYFFTNNVEYDNSPAGEGTAFEIQLKAIAQGGTVKIENGLIEASNCNSVTLLLVSATSFNGFDKSPSKQGKDPALLCDAYMKEAGRVPYKKLLQNHINDYGSLFSRVNLQLSEQDEPLLIPTDERIKKYKAEKDPGLIALYMQFGRYLLLSSSRAGSQPANLQGIWNKNINAPWGSNYTLNCNTEINYWPAEAANLPECHLPLINMVRELVADGRKTARLVYGTGGWVAHHTTDIWRTTVPVDESVSWSMFPGAGAWLCQHLWEHYAFTKDREYLLQVWPVMKEAAMFYLENLQRHPETGQWLISPDVNFENHYRWPDGSINSLGAGITATMQMVRQLFTNCMHAANMLEKDSAFRKELEKVLPGLPSINIDTRTGELQEWMEPHRHAFPERVELLSSWGAVCANQVSVDSTPELANALRIAFDNRAGWRHDAVGSWQGAFQANVYARLHDGDTALAVLNKHMEKMVNPNLTAGFIQAEWEIDGNLGMTAAVCEMLLQSQHNTIELLPALPKAWSSGSVKGLKARGSFTVDIEWKNGSVTNYKISSPEPEKVSIKVNGEIKEIISSKN